MQKSKEGDLGENLGLPGVGSAYGGEHQEEKAEAESGTGEKQQQRKASLNIVFDSGVPQNNPKPPGVNRLLEGKLAGNDITVVATTSSGSSDLSNRKWARPPFSRRSPYYLVGDFETPLSPPLPPPPPFTPPAPWPLFSSPLLVRSSHVSAPLEHPQRRQQEQQELLLQSEKQQRQGKDEKDVMSWERGDGYGSLSDDGDGDSVRSITSTISSKSIGSKSIGSRSPSFKKEAKASGRSGSSKIYLLTQKWESHKTGLAEKGGSGHVTKLKGVGSKVAAGRGVVVKSAAGGIIRRLSPRAGGQFEETQPQG
mmetsp:Transcript_53760/g.108003  ORF Transcript_53760/g.108003 Transcript_53760/m.108003 type:complete len:310 (+) Transcript_53760:378-1307(+)